MLFFLYLRSLILGVSYNVRVELIVLTLELLPVRTLEELIPFDTLLFTLVCCESVISIVSNDPWSFYWYKSSKILRKIQVLLYSCDLPLVFSSWVSKGGNYLEHCMCVKCPVIGY